MCVCVCARSFELIGTPIEVSRSGNPPTLTLLPNGTYYAFVVNQ